MQRASDREIADSLLVEWYQWSKMWRPSLGAPRITVACREYRGDEKHNEENEEAREDRIYHAQMETVDFCLSAIAVPMQQAIGIEMKNREAKHRVWRCPGASSFAAAMDAIAPVMRRRGLFD